MIVVVLCSATAALAVIMAGAWAVQLRTGQSGWIDTIWSFAVGVIGAAAVLAPIAGQEGLTVRQMLIAVCVLAWSVRLGLHIMRRTLRGGDDPRYNALRAEWGADFVFRLFLFLQLQATAALVLVICVFVAARNTAPPGWGDALGLAILTVAVLGEAAADAQLARFAGSPGAKGAVCEIGLWRYSRHPNYFFEWLAWLSYPVIAVGLPADNLYGLIALTGPAMIYWLLVHVSGIPPLEAHMLKSRGAAFADYQKRVSAFFLGPQHA